MERAWRGGLTQDDTQDDAAWIIKKVLAAKLWDGDDAWRRSVVDVEGEVLCGESSLALEVALGCGSDVLRLSVGAGGRATRPELAVGSTSARGIEVRCSHTRRAMGGRSPLPHLISPLLLSSLPPPLSCPSPPPSLLIPLSFSLLPPSPSLPSASLTPVSQFTLFANFKGARPGKLLDPRSS